MQVLLCMCSCVCVCTRVCFAFCILIKETSLLLAIFLTAGNALALLKDAFVCAEGGLLGTGKWHALICAHSWDLHLLTHLWVGAILKCMFTGHAR